MANNLVEYLAQLRQSDPKRANWILDCPDVGTNDWGFGRVRLCKEIIAGTRVSYDFKSAYSTNPTISPVLSRAKVSVSAWWIPIRLYVPALRDGVEVKSGKTDYSFPTINFDYAVLRNIYDASSSSSMRAHGAGLPYIPANSIFSELHMWMPYYQPIGFASKNLDSVPAVYPEPKNAIPLLGYYDIFRNYIMNTQAPSAPIRVQGYSRIKVVVDDTADLTPNRQESFYSTINAVDSYKTREQFDTLFREVRRLGSSFNYPTGDGNFNVSTPFSSFFGIPSGTFAPLKKIIFGEDAEGNLINTLSIAYNDNHFGEWRQTYLSNYYTAYLSNENVEYERSTARVQTDESGVITMEQIYSAQKVQNYIRKTVFKNSDYAEFIDVHYGVTPSTSITKPMFMGNVSTWLTFNDVIAQAQGGTNGTIESNNDLGSRASLGFGRMVTGKLRGNNDREFVEFTAKEPGYFMVIETIVPEVSYWQGFDPMYDKRTLESLYYPEFDRDGYQDKQVKYFIEQHAASFNTLPVGARFDEFNQAIAQEPAWWEYMTTYPRMSGQMVDNGVYRHWVFNDDFGVDYLDGTGRPVPDNYPPNYGFLSENPFDDLLDVYVRPEKFNSIFANINGLDNIQTYYRHELKLYQPMSHRFLSF